MNTASPTWTGVSDSGAFPTVLFLAHEEADWKSLHGLIHEIFGINALPANYASLFDVGDLAKQIEDSLDRVVRSEETYSTVEISHPRFGATLVDTEAFRSGLEMFVVQSLTTNFRSGDGCVFRVVRTAHWNAADAGPRLRFLLDAKKDMLVVVIINDVSLDSSHVLPEDYVSSIAEANRCFTLMRHTYPEKVVELSMVNIIDSIDALRKKLICLEWI